MFDEMTFKSKVTHEQAEHIIDKLYLQECTRGEAVYWQSSAYGKFDAVHAIIMDGKLTMRFSCHKLWSKWAGEGLDNSRPFSMTDALATISALLSLLQLPSEQVRCDRFELGLSMAVPDDPLRYISSVESIGDAGHKEFFVDANYQKDRQRTTLRARTYKKIFKIYDKTYEMQEKGHEVSANILRIETIYKRQSMPLDTLLSPDNIRRLLQRFWADWCSIQFSRDVVGCKGTKASQLEKARGIMTQGLTEYRSAQRREYLDRRISKKTWETIRTFCDQWKDRWCSMFIMAPGQLETSYRSIMSDTYAYART